MHIKTASTITPDTPISYLKGIGPYRADLLQRELQIFTYKDLLEHFPLRHLDKTSITPILQLNSMMDYVMVAGRIMQVSIVGERQSKRLVAILQDASGAMELTWFQGINWIEKKLVVGAQATAFGRLGWFMGKPQITHGEVEVIGPGVQPVASTLLPVYPSTEKLKQKGLNGRQLAEFTALLKPLIKEETYPENLPPYLLQKHGLLPRAEAMMQVHFPRDYAAYEQAIRRLKFEELFLAQLRLQLIRLKRHRNSRAVVFEKVGDLFNQFYHHHLPFQLTNAQKKVIREIRLDVSRGYQMNRLLQGDVGSGKTMVALMAMLMAAGNGYQSCMLAPTEILATQHFHSLKQMLQDLPVNVALLTGSVKGKARTQLLNALVLGHIHIIVGTHALIEDKVVFDKLGLAVVDEQHRFGVAQRAKLWAKASLPPHMLVMTATPIPRTLAMTAYGDLDYSVMDELPPGRQPVLTVQRNETTRTSVYDFIKEQIAEGRQAYIIYPLIEESETLSYEDLMQGYELVKAYFPEPKFYISMVHGRQDPGLKEVNMQRFVRNDTQLMVSTTVIEVGVNVPNASVMLIENAEKFGLSQLHQLRGRVGRGSDKSYCILLTGQKVSADARERLNIMCQTNDGFKIAEKDLELRGPGDIDGTRQSGALNFKLADLTADKDLLEKARHEAEQILLTDESLSQPMHEGLKNHLQQNQSKTAWGKIS